MRSNQHNKQENTLLYHFTRTGLSNRLCDTQAFKEFNAALEVKFKTPGTANAKSKSDHQRNNERSTLSNILRNASCVLKALLV